MQNIFASKLTSRLLSSSTAIRSRANSFSDWAEKQTTKKKKSPFYLRSGKSVNWTDAGI